MICYKCKEEKSLESFTKDSRNTKRGVQSYCKACMLNYGREHRKNNAEQYRIRSREQSATPKQRLKHLLNANTVDRKDLDFSWAWEKLNQLDFKCEITKAPFTWEARSPRALSIDRIDPTKPYTKENVRFVCWWVNAAMGNWGLDKLKQLLEDWNATTEV